MCRMAWDLIWDTSCFYKSKTEEVKRGGKSAIQPSWCCLLIITVVSTPPSSMRRYRFRPSWLYFSSTRHRSSKSYFWHAYELRLQRQLEACATFCLLLSALHLSTKKDWKQVLNIGSALSYSKELAERFLGKQSDFFCQFSTKT